MYQRLYSYLCQQNILNEAQFGFRKHSFTAQAEALLVKKIANAFEDKKKTLCVFLDLSKAFDTIDHSILLSNLNHCGIGGVAHSWFSSFLNNQKK